MKKIAFINQRYGVEVNGGSEVYTRIIAEKLSNKYNVEVLTTCCLDCSKWENYYKAGTEYINGVKVRRFPTTRVRIPYTFGPFNSEAQKKYEHSRNESLRWNDDQGPYSPSLIEYVKIHANEYDAFIVVTYLYYPAVRSLEFIGHKAIFIPTAHPEPCIHFKCYEDVFNAPKAYVFLTDEEKELVHSLFPATKEKPYDVMGMGVDLPDNVDGDAFRKKYKVEDYIIYVGRICEAKGCPQMMTYFMEYKKRNPSNLKLVLLGNDEFPIPRHPDIRHLGFVSNEDKFNGIKGAKLLLLPSAFESLSIAVLEAMKLSVPVVVNGRCAVLKGHCIKSNAGLYYGNYFEFEGCLNYLLTHGEAYEAMKKNASRYVETNYNWEKIMGQFDRIIDIVANQNEETV